MTRPLLYIGEYRNLSLKIAAIMILCPDHHLFVSISEHWQNVQLGVALSSAASFSSIFSLLAFFAPVPANNKAGWRSCYSEI